MSTFLNVGDVLNVKHVFDLNGNKAFNVWYYRLKTATVTATGLPQAAGPPFINVATPIATAFWNHYYNAWKNIGSIDVSYQSCTIQNIYPSPRSLPITFTQLPEASKGLFVGDPLPLQDAVTFLKKTDIGEKYGQGRVFITGLSEDQQIDGVINPVNVVDFQGAATNMATLVTASASGTLYTFEPVLFNSKTDPPRILQVKNVILSDSVLKTQRRRRPGKGI